MKKKYALYPSDVISQNDGQRHYITARRLCELYGVDPNECMIAPLSRRGSIAAGYDPKFIASLIPLRPRYDGHYSLPQS